MSRLQVKALDKSFGRQAVLKGLDLEVTAGSLTAVLGPSGCGKTTLLRLVAGFDRADSGEIRLGDVVVAAAGRHISPEKRQVTVVPQEGALFPHLDVTANVVFGVDRARRKAGHRVVELLELVGMGGLGGRMPSELSGGQQQRVALARALAPDPQLILLDEPFAALDAGLRLSLRVEVAAALRLAGATALLVTHDQEEALSTADSVAVMADGVIRQHASPLEVYHQPVDLGVARFVGEAVELAAVADGPYATTALGRHRLPMSACGAGVVVLRPEQLAVGANGVSATVVEERFFGTSTVLTLRLAGSSDVVRARTTGSHPIGTTVKLQVLSPVVFFAI
ncbi:MAG: ABC transporter ATP-binding protein [Nocardioidaceae bacterium]